MNRPQTRATAYIAAVLFLAASPAKASLVSYNFTASVLKMYEFDAAAVTITEVASSNFAGFVIDSSWTITGSYHYDTTASLSTDFQPEIPLSGQHIAYQSNTPLAGLAYSFSLGGQPFSSSSSLRLEVGNDASTLMGWDVFYTRGRMDISDSLFQQVSLSLYDDTATVFSGPFIPASLEISAFHLNRLNSLFMRSDGSSLTVEAQLTTWQRVEPSSLPEPHGLGLSISAMLCALGLSAAVRRAALPKE
jgi:hypothetical protein